MPKKTAADEQAADARYKAAVESLQHLAQAIQSVAKNEATRAFVQTRGPTKKAIAQIRANLERTVVGVELELAHLESEREESGAAPIPPA